MEFTHDNVIKWFDEYFKNFNRNNGDPRTIPLMKKYFTPDLQFVSYLLNVKRPEDRDGLLNSMLHPGLHEELTPKYYVVDAERKAVVVQLGCRFHEDSTGTTTPESLLSCHYYLVQDEKGDIKIQKILFFAEQGAPGESSTMGSMKKYREEALKTLPENWLAD
jgi:hypothetical protein